jgi:hypothetical protein
MKLKAKAFAHNREIDMEIEISEEELARLTVTTETKKDSGYGFGHHNQLHYTVLGDGSVLGVNSDSEMEVRDLACNLYHNEELAKDDARADLLMRKLRRYAAENNTEPIDWSDIYQAKWYIAYDRGDCFVTYVNHLRGQGAVHFNTKEIAQAALDKYYGEIVWYFTEYSSQ